MKNLKLKEKLLRQQKDNNEDLAKFYKEIINPKEEEELEENNMFSTEYVRN